MSKINLTAEQANTPMAKEFLGTIGAMNDFYDKALMRNALYTKIRNYLVGELTTTEELKNLLSVLNPYCKENFKFVIYSDRHKVHKLIKEYEEKAD